MKTKTQKILAADANMIAAIIVETDTEQRHEIYKMVADKLEQRSQHFQAVHFRLLVEREKGMK